MKKLLFIFLAISLEIQAQQTGTCTAGTEFCETSSSASNNTNTNNNTNINTNINTSTNNNTNINTNNNTTNTTSNSTSVNTSTSDVNSNVNSTNTNNNLNESFSESNVNTQNKNININESYSGSEQYIKQKSISPPPTATAPSIGSSFSQDLCSTGISAALQTQILGISSGTSVTDLNCERIKLAKVLYDAGMRVASVSILCQDSRVFKAMNMAGTPCPYNGLIGEKAAQAWKDNPKQRPDYNEWFNDEMEKCMATFLDRQTRKSKKVCEKELSALY